MNVAIHQLAKNNTNIITLTFQPVTPVGKL